MVTAHVGSAAFAREYEFHRVALMLAPYLEPLTGPDRPLYQVCADFRIAVEEWHRYLSASMFDPPSLAWVWDEAIALLSRHGIYAIGGVVARALLAPWLLRRATLSDAYLVHLGFLLDGMRAARLAAFGLL